MAEPDYATWLTKEQAAAAIVSSTKTVERYANAGRIQKATWRRPHGPAVVVYDPGDVETIATERRQEALAAFLVPGSAVAMDPRPAPTGDGAGTRELARLLIELVAAVRSLGTLPAIAATSETPVAGVSETVSQASVLTIAQVAARTGWTRTYIRRRIKDKTLRAEKDRGWKIRVKDLEAL